MTVARAGETRRDVRRAFMQHVTKQRRTGCWIWRGEGDGYGQFRGLAAHRVSWELAHGPIEPGLVLLHGCDVKGCVNPMHLRPGTQQENIDDAKRARAKARREPRRERRGQDLDPKAIRKIRLSVNVNAYEQALIQYWARSPNGGDSSLSEAVANLALRTAIPFAREELKIWRSLPSWVPVPPPEEATP